ncbi:YjbF family lipoprotein [Acetobacteraceae bacterium H6797]|nr:YjbF family lipoprotein [Acetobacteraceae bacterium H6797]
MRLPALTLCLLTAACSWMPESEDITGLFASSQDPAPPLTLPAPPREVGVGEPALRLTMGERRITALLVQHNGEMRMWRSPDGVVVATDGARVVATAGLPVWIAGSRIDGEDPLDDPAAILGRTVPMRRSIDLMSRNRSPDDMHFGVSFNCRLRAKRQEEAILVEEGCYGGGQGFINRFWADPASGAVWRSQQWVGEKGEPMLVEVMVPPRG